MIQKLYLEDNSFKAAIISMLNDEEKIAKERNKNYKNKMKVLQLKTYINFLNWLNNIFEITGNVSKLTIKIQKLSHLKNRF